MVGICRAVNLAAVDYHHDITYEAAKTSSWALAKCGTAVILVCCPLLRPVLEALVPNGLVNVYYSRPRHSRTKIVATTRIDVMDDSRRQKPSPMKLMESVDGAPKFATP